MKKFNSLFRKNAFTLAETLIVLGIIGVVAALTVPTLMKAYNEKVFDTSASNFNRKFAEALKILNNQELLAGQKTTENFVNKLGKYFKIVKVCATPTDCFEDTVIWGEAGNADINKIKKSKDLVSLNKGEKDWGTNVVGLKFANGINALLTYNPQCEQNPYNNNLINITSNPNSKNTIVDFNTDCIAMLYDVNGLSKPDRLSKDIRKTSNVKPLVVGCSGTLIGEQCYTSIPTSDYTPVDCTKEDFKDYCGEYFGHSNDYWAGANFKCAELGMKTADREEAIKLINDGQLVLEPGHYWGNSEDIRNNGAYRNTSSARLFKYNSDGSINTGVRSRSSGSDVGVLCMY